MTRLSFECDFTSSELRSVPLPVEVRKQNLALIARTVSSASVTVTEPGTYHIMATLPAGQELYSAVTVNPGDTDKVVTLTLEPEDTTLDESFEATRGFLQAPVAARLESLNGDELNAKLRVFSGNVLRNLLERRHAEVVGPRLGSVPGAGVFYFRPSDARVAQLLQPHEPPVNVMLPITPPRSAANPPLGCQLALARQPSDGYSIDVHLENLVGDALLRFVERGQVDRAATQTTAPTLDQDRSFLSGPEAEVLLADKVSDPISAAVAAYALLRLGDLERLHDWTSNLRNWFEWLADGLVIHAEHLARLGQHDRALAALLELPARGLPIFTDGLSYAVDRLRLYASTKSAGFSADSQQKATILRNDLQAFATFADLRKPVVTWSGLDPTHPSGTSLGWDIDHYDGLSVSEWVG